MLNSLFSDRLSVVDLHYSRFRFHDHVLFFGIYILQVVNVGPDIRFDYLGIKTCAFWSYRHGGIILLRLYLQNKTSKDFAFHRNQCKLQISKDYLVWK